MLIVNSRKTSLQIKKKFRIWIFSSIEQSLEQRSHSDFWRLEVVIRTLNSTFEQTLLRVTILSWTSSWIFELKFQ